MIRLKVVLLSFVIFPFSALAEIVQITFDGNIVSGFPVNDNIDSDFTGDGVSDMPLLLVEPYEEIILGGGTDYTWEMTISNSGATLGFASFLRNVNTEGVTTYTSAVVKTFGEESIIASGAASTIGSFPVTLSDQRINNGSLTEGIVEIRPASYGPPGSPAELSIELVRLIFDDSNIDLTQPVDLFESFPEWAPIVKPDKSAMVRLLSTKIAKLNRKAKQALRKKQSAKARRLFKLARKIQGQINAL